MVLAIHAFSEKAFFSKEKKQKTLILFAAGTYRSWPVITPEHAA
jgi:hypothetical protein